MSVTLYLPPDAFSGNRNDPDLAADYLELTALPDDTFRDDVLVLGNVLHRLRLPLRVMEAEALAKRGVAIEAFDELPDIVAWLQDYRRRGALA